MLIASVSTFTLSFVHQNQFLVDIKDYKTNQSIQEYVPLDTVHKLKVYLENSFSKFKDSQQNNLTLNLDTLNQNNKLILFLDFTNKCIWLSFNNTHFCYLTLSDAFSLESQLTSVCNCYPLFILLNNKNENTIQKPEATQEMKEIPPQIEQQNNVSANKEIDIEKAAEIANALITAENLDQNALNNLVALIKDYTGINNITPDTIKNTVASIKETINNHLKNNTIFDVCNSLMYNQFSKDYYKKYIEQEQDRSKQIKYIVTLIFLKEIIDIVNLSNVL